MGDKNSFVLYMDLLSVLDELDDEETAMLFRAIRAYNQLESENEAIRTKAAEDLEAMTANKTVRIAFAPIRKRLEADNKRYAETVQLNKANGKLGGAPKGNQNARKKKKNTETEETSQNNQNTGWFGCFRICYFRGRCGDCRHHCLKNYCKMV